VGFVAGVGLLSRLPKTPESFAPSGRPSAGACAKRAYAWS
jgi:hypothetical protein